MGAVFMSVILHGMLFDVFATPRRARQGTAGTEQAKNTQKVQPTQHRRHIGSARGAWLESVGLTLSLRWGSARKLPADL